VLAVAVVAANAAADESAAPTADEIAALVRQLGAAKFAEREQATRRLAQIGVPAKEALLAALASGDAEVRGRAQRLLDLVLERDFQIRLREFQADANPGADHGLPLWDTFRQQVGDDAGARQLFVAMQRAEFALLEAARGDGPTTAAALDARLAQVNEASDFDDGVSQRHTPLGRIAAWLFVGARADVPLSDNAAYSLVGISSQRPFRDGISGGPLAGSLKRLLGRWVLRDLSDRPNLQFQNLLDALRWELPETLPLAIRLVGDTQAEAYFRPYPILAIAHFGGPEHLPLLEPLLADESVLMESEIDDGGRAVQCQARDVALLALVHITGQAPADYGLPKADPVHPLGYDPELIGFADDTARQAALARWRQWREQN
jgi:hypothetical protein